MILKAISVYIMHVIRTRAQREIALAAAGDPRALALIAYHLDGKGDALPQKGAPIVKRWAPGVPVVGVAPELWRTARLTNLPNVGPMTLEYRQIRKVGP